MEIDVEPSNIAAAIFGNDKSSDDEGSESEGTDEEGDVGGSADVEDGGTESENATEGGTATDTDGSRKHHYRKQNPARRNTVLLFIVSCEGA